MPDNDMLLMKASKTIEEILDTTLKTSCTFMVMKGMEIDHAHIKLYPVYKIRIKINQDRTSMDYYDGYISTLHGLRVDDNEL